MVSNEQKGHVTRLHMSQMSKPEDDQGFAKIRKSLFVLHSRRLHGCTFTFARATFPPILISMDVSKKDGWAVVGGHRT